MKKILLTSCLACLLLASCATKESAVNQLRSFRQEIEVNGMTYGLKDWKKAANDYSKINKRIFKHYNEYSPAELEEVARLNAECVSSFAKGTVTNISQKAQGVAGAIKGIIEGFSESLGTPKK